MPRKARLALGLSLGALALVAAVAPFSLMLLPNPVPLKVAGVSAQPNGTYVATARGTFRVPLRGDRVDAFPADSLVADPTARVWVKYRLLDDLAGYGIYTYPGGRSVPVRKDSSRLRLLGILPVSPLPAGRYYVEVARESTFGGTDYAYFSVASAPPVGGK